MKKTELETADGENEHPQELDEDDDMVRWAVKLFKDHGREDETFDLTGLDDWD